MKKNSKYKADIHDNFKKERDTGVGLGKVIDTYLLPSRAVQVARELAKLENKGPENIEAKKLLASLALVTKIRQNNNKILL